jgi:hypothetical protein
MLKTAKIKYLATGVVCTKVFTFIIQSYKKTALIDLYSRTLNLNRLTYFAVFARKVVFTRASVITRGCFITSALIYARLSVTSVYLCLTTLPSESRLAYARIISSESVNAFAVVAANAEIAHVHVLVAQKTMESERAFAVKSAQCASLTSGSIFAWFFAARVDFDLAISA